MKLFVGASCQWDAVAPGDGEAGQKDGAKELPAGLSPWTALCSAFVAVVPVPDAAARAAASSEGVRTLPFWIVDVPEYSQSLDGELISNTSADFGI